MSKRGLRATQMLTEAREWANQLTMIEMQSPTEPLELVWHRLERKTGVPYGTFWSLRYRFDQIKDIWASTYSLLREARVAETERHLRRLQHSIGVEAAKETPTD